MAKGTLNTQTIIGHVGKAMTTGKIAELAIATNSGVTNETEWFDVKVISESLVKLVTEHVKKGQLIYVSGETFTEKWVNRDGEPKSKKRVLARSIEILNWNSSKGKDDKKSEREAGK